MKIKGLVVVLAVLCAVPAGAQVVSCISPGNSCVPATNGACPNRWTPSSLPCPNQTPTPSSSYICCSGGAVLFPCQSATECKGGALNMNCPPASIVPSGSCASTTPTPTPTATPTPGPVGTPVAVAKVAGFTMPTTAFLYAPECVVWPPPVLPPAKADGSLAAGVFLQQSDPYWCLNTMGDAISLFTSTDKVHWTMRQQVLTALPGTWEDNSNRGFSYPNGVSNMVVSRSRTSGTLIAAYTAGQSPNNAASGGIGLAYSADGTHWTRYAGNPILPGNGYAYAQRLLRLSDGLWLYVTDGSFNVARIKISDYDGVPLGSFVPLPDLKNTLLLGFDADGCWLSEGIKWVDVGWNGVNIYHGGDCSTTKGSLVATIMASDLGKKGIMHLSLVERSLEGGLLGGPSLILSVGDSWATWTPTSVTLGLQKPVWSQPLFVSSWSSAK